MESSWPTWVAAIIGLYAAVGIVFALPFVVFGIDRIDPGSRGSSLGFRLLVLPGSAALWPLMAWRWATATSPPDEITEHRRNA